MKIRTALLVGALYGMLLMRGNAFFGLVDTVDGQQLAGKITFASDHITISIEEGDDREIKLEQLKRLQPIDPTSIPEAAGKTAESSGVWATYFRGRNLDGEHQSRIDPGIQFNWKNGSPLGDYPADQFSVRWETLVEAPVTGLYTFTTMTDDGVRLRVDNKMIIDQWRDQSVTEVDGQIHLEEGKRYELVMEYYENSGEATAILKWAYPGQTKYIVPGDRLFLPEKFSHAKLDSSPQKPQGILGLYYETMDLSGPFNAITNPTINFNWRNTKKDHFSVHWLGRLHPDRTDDYTFHVESDDGVRLYVNGKKLVDNWHDGSFKRSSEPIHLEAGKDYNLNYAMYEQSGPALARLFWSSPNLPRTIISPRQLSPVRPPVMKSEDWIQGKGVYLIDGTVINRRVHVSDAFSLKFSNSSKDPILALKQVARVHFKDIKPDMVKELPPGQSGLLLESGDFLEGEIRSIKGSNIRISSILLGLKSYNQNKILAAVFHERKILPTQFEIETKDQSRFLVNRWVVEKESLLLKDPALNGFNIPTRNITKIERRNLK